MKTKLNIAIDLETASLKSDAAILSIAALPFFPCNFNAEDGKSVFSEDDGDCFYLIVNNNSCIAAGLHVDMDTVRWWSTRSDEAKAEILAPPVLLASALDQFTTWLEAMSVKYNATPILWAQGSDFDFPILRNAYAACGQQEPWHRTQMRDARTYLLEMLEFLFGQMETPYDAIPDMPQEEWVRHSALSDARKMAWNVSFVKDFMSQTDLVPNRFIK